MAQSAREILLLLKAGGEDDGVFDGEAGALTEIGTDGMCGVTEDGDATDDPGKSGEAILNFCADRADGASPGDARVPGQVVGREHRR